MRTFSLSTVMIALVAIYGLAAVAVAKPADKPVDVAAVAGTANDNKTPQAGKAEDVKGTETIAVKPCGPAKAGEPEKTGETPKPAEAAKPAKSAKPAAVAKPAKAAKAAESANPAEAVKPGDPKAVEEKPVEAKPADPKPAKA